MSDDTRDPIAEALDVLDGGFDDAVTGNVPTDRPNIVEIMPDESDYLWIERSYLRQHEAALSLLRTELERLRGMEAAGKGRPTARVRRGEWLMGLLETYAAMGRVARRPRLCRVCASSPDTDEAGRSVAAWLLGMAFGLKHSKTLPLSANDTATCAFPVTRALLGGGRGLDAIERACETAITQGCQLYGGTEGVFQHAHRVANAFIERSQP